MKETRIFLAIYFIIGAVMNAQAFELPTVKLGAKIGKAQLQKIVSSKTAYCFNYHGTKIPVSTGAIQVFNASATSRTKSVRCNGKFLQKADQLGIEVINLSKSKMTAEAYKTLGLAVMKKGWL